LFHLTDITQYDPKELYLNEKVNKNKRFLEKQLSNLLTGGKHNTMGYNKRQFNSRIVSAANVRRMFAQQPLFATELEQIIDKLGSNVSDLIFEIVPALKKSL